MRISSWIHFKKYFQYCITILCSSMFINTTLTNQYNRRREISLYLYVTFSKTNIGRYETYDGLFYVTFGYKIATLQKVNILQTLFVILYFLPLYLSQFPEIHVFIFVFLLIILWKNIEIYICKLCYIARKGKHVFVDVYVQLDTLHIRLK